MRRIDYLLNAKDPIKVLVNEFDLELDCYGCPDYSGCDVCNGNCYNAFIEYLEEDIEVNESDLKTVEIKEKANAKETLQETLDEVKETLQKTLDEVKEPVENNNVNTFMKEYKKIVTETMELCVKKNKDYGNATDESFKQFGNVSYQVRCFDKWSRINTLLKNGKAEVSESLEDSLLDLANYLFLWVTSRRLNEK